MTYGYMNSIHFWNTHKGDLPQCLYIFGKTEPLDMAIKNLACYMLGTMSYLDIQKRKGDMNTA